MATIKIKQIKSKIGAPIGSEAHASVIGIA